MSIALAVMLAAQPSGTSAYPATSSGTSSIQGPPAPRPVRAKLVAAGSDPCQRSKVEPGVILVCGKREDYRIDPDVLKAQRMIHKQLKPRPPERFVDTSCQIVGVMGCINKPTINVLQAVSTAAAMAKALMNGDNVSKMFITQHELSEYELYQQAKHEREEKEMGSADLSGE